MILKDRFALITGGSLGLGKEIARKFILEGASVMLCARKKEILAQTQRELSKLCRKNQKVLIQKTDVSIIQNVDTLIDKTFTEFPHLDILVNNSAVVGPVGRVENNDIKQWIKTIEINLLGVFFLCQKILPHFKQKRYGKIINLSGGGATFPFPAFSAYGTSKAAVVRFTEILAEEVKDFGIDVNAVAPGMLNTRLIDQFLKAGPPLLGNKQYQKFIQCKKTGITSLEKGASLCVFLASSKSDGITGKLISSIWDPWKNFEKYKMDLKTTDIFTLRRIVPEDRGKKW